MIVFFARSWRGYFKHKVLHVELSRARCGDSVDFEMTARCGEVKLERRLVLEPEMVADADDCPSCFPVESKQP